MDPADALREDVRATLKHIVPAASLVLETPPRDINADLAFPCFSLAKKYRKNPAQVAELLAGKLKPHGLIGRIEAAGPYLNFHADWDRLGNLLLREILARSERYGSGKPTARKILVEFAHPNTHKAFHIGHVRNIALGEALSRLLAFSGNKVVRVNYQGDIGPHVAKCLWGILHLKLKKPAKDRGRWLGEVYAEASKRAAADPKVEQQVREINRQLYAGDKALRKLWQETRAWSLGYFAEIYKDFGVHFDRLYFESEVEAPGIARAQELLKKRIAKRSDGAIVMDLKKFDLGVYVLVTQDETPLYSIKDVALADLQEREHGPDQIIHVVGTEQLLHFQQLFKTLELTVPGLAKKELHVPYELVNLKEGKMSSREGRIITYDELKREVLAHAVKETEQHAPHAPSVEKIARMIAQGGIVYDMVKHSPEKVIVFDWEQALRFEGNAAPYLQYTHARASSIIAKAGGVPAQYKAGNLDLTREIALLRKVMDFPETVQVAARDRRPHYIANYAFGLATIFNDFYQNVTVLKAEEEEVKKARLALVQAVRITLGNALRLIGVEAPEQM